MYNDENVAGTGGRKVNYADGNVADDFGRRRCGRDDVAGDFGRRCDRDDVAGDFGRRRCDFVYECLLDLIEDALDDNGHRRRRNNCDFVYECFEDLLEDAGGNNNCKCRRD